MFITFKNHRGWGWIFVIAIVFFLLSVAPTANAGGKQEDSLSKADRLIAERKYNEAILVLTAFIRKEPSRFDDAQRRLQKIVHLRDNYNSLAEELLNVLVNDPTNDERKLAMIRQLERLEAAPNRAAREFILRTKETALFTYNRAQFEKIMADGRSLIDKKEYVQAAKRYTDGFSLYRDEFYQAGYGDLVVSRVDAGLKTISTDLNHFNTLFDRFKNAIASVVQVSQTVQEAGGLPAVTVRYDAAEPTILEFASLRNSAVSVGRSFENQFLLLQGADKNLGDSSFLPFAFRFILGRKTEVQPEGIVGSMDTLWAEQVNLLQTALTQSMDRAYDSAVKSLSSDPPSQGERNFTLLAQNLDTVLRGIDLWAAVAAFEISPTLTPLGRSIVTGKPGDFIKYQSMIKASRYLVEAVKVAQNLDAQVASVVNPNGLPLAGQVSVPTPLENWRSGNLDTPTALQQEQTIRQGISRIIAQIDEQLRRIGGDQQEVQEYVAQKLTAETTESYLDTAKKYVETLKARSLSMEIDTADREYTIANGDLDQRLKAQQTADQKAQTLLAGEKITAPDGSTYVAKYPKESVPLLTTIDQTLRGDTKAAGDLLARYDAEGEPIKADPRLTALRKEAQDLAAAFTALQAQVRSLTTQANNMIAQAESSRLEGDRRYEEARAALARQNFDVARERLQRAGERYDASLALQESPTLRADRDTKLLALSAEISKAENLLVVRDVRRLITDGKNYYFGGDFAKAEDSLVQAQNRWRTTNVEDEPEVAYWLTLVRGALSIKTGRTIPVTAPLYAEMSQLLSSAQRDYEAGKNLLDSRKRTEALGRFNDAKQKIQQVRIVFPINQEASLLELRIDQLIDPAAFNTSFAKRFADARSNLKTKPQEAYSDLQDLAAINPNYPGIKTVIAQAEIDLGLRLPPPDPKALARSNELTKAAQGIVDANIRSQFPVALEQLNEALKLNPNNAQASVLKDRIQTDVGGQAVVVLSSAAEREYQRAVQELQQGNNIVALAIVQQLLQDPVNRNSSRILELQKRIQARL